MSRLLRTITKKKFTKMFTVFTAPVCALLRQARDRLCEWLYVLFLQMPDVPGDEYLTHFRS